VLGFLETERERGRRSVCGISVEGSTRPGHGSETQGEIPGNARRCNQSREAVDEESEDGAMTLVKRHMGRRVAAVGVAAALLVLGLEAPAFAATTVTSFTPTSAGVGCAVTITGTEFTGATAVKFFNNVTASFVVNSATQITAIVPAAAADGPIEVTAPGGTDASGTDFDVTAAVCPTITSFTPTSGPVGTSVVITGTNFTGATAVTFNNVTATFTVNSATQITATVPTTATTGLIRVTTSGGTTSSLTNFTIAAPTITSFTPTSGPVGTSVKITGTNFTGATAVTFNNVTATFTVNSVTQITATVPATATTGKIKVTTPGGSVTSTADFVVSIVHSRSVTLSLKKHLVAKGVVSVGDGFTACVASVPVKIQRRVSGSWKAVGSTTTTASGSYSKKIKDKTGKYRAKAPKVTLNAGADVCKGAKSPVRKHTH
jgi:IPT/TIG domain